MSEVVREMPAKGVVMLRINRPEARNALNMRVRRRLAEEFQSIHGDDKVRAVVLTGDDKAFAAGADLKEFAELTAVEQMRRQTHRLFASISACPKPVIAAVNGYALGGGCELAMHADIIVAGQNARFGQPEVRVGLMPGAGGTQRLTRAVGKFRAMKLVLLGEPISGAEAAQMGLASEVVPDEQVLPRALEMAEKIAALPPLAIEQIKEVLLAGMDASLEAGLMLERKAFQLLFATEDQKEGARAFAEKRQPSFKGS
ncbi:MAG TPA: enoyl-CoA hydratase-related protein [Kiloniellales bacterium]|jgi:enoyl-CoA hydratase|nr:enoyl-CoA hydratase-related protein [Kiloniellales bacterium]